MTFTGKTLKGQTQKVQQAVLQKFRAGGYNVIVATSIGEEGLDIMEVDLVICFDANISPLRMIQRMGRTGRKHDGRVVILACEGSELKGYLRKQANSRAVRKHMHSGGIKSFDFHPSPRMVPHICKPQVQCVELSIEQFVPRGKKVGDGFTHRSPVSKKMSKEEKGLIARYFHSSKEDSWKPSLIAFPSFQAFASRVHKVSHSYKTTGMLIDAMQRLQGPSFFVVNQVLSFEVNTSSDQTKEIVAVAHESNCGKVFEKSITVHHCTNEAPRGTLQVEDLNSDKSSKVISEGRDGSHMPKPNLPEESISVLHHFLFGEEFVTVNVYGDVSILSVPTLPSTKETPRSKSVMIPETFRSLNNTLAAPLELTDTSRGKYTDNKEVLVYASPKFDSQAQKLHRVDSILLKNPISGENLRLLKDYVTKVPVEARNACSASQVCKTANAISDMELSPRLTHFIEKGVVPESPTVKSNHYLPKAACSVGTDIVYEHEECGLLHVRANIHEKRKISDTISHSTTVIETPMKNNSPAPANDSPCSPKLSTSLPSSGIPKHDKNGIERAENSVRETDTGKCNSLEPLNEHTPLVNRTNDSCSEDWKLSSAKVSKSIHQSPKYRRLRKHCDIARNLPCKNLEENFCSSVTKFCQRTNRTTLKQAKDVRGKQKDKININYFIEEEAMVSSDVEVSEDEKDDKDEDAYDDSFIDDGTNSAEASIRTKSSGSDMMAFYRRSLLTQSPMAVGSPLFPATCANELSPRTAETASCSSERVNNSLQTPGNGWQHGNQSRNRNLITFKTGIERENSVTANGVASQPTEEESKLESRKRKLSFQHVGLVSAISLRQEHQAKTECIAIKSAPCQPDHNDMDSDVVFDDDFYKGLDLDAVEAQATKLLRDKSETCAKQQASPVPSIKFQDPDENLPAFPSFDLGIHFS
uniref:Fanconi anemia group M n=2 Tax=Anthurium amnicola TaxID=1678845 RepID=A0A1D1YNM4_9ARAE